MLFFTSVHKDGMGKAHFSGTFVGIIGFLYLHGYLYKNIEVVVQNPLNQLVSCESDKIRSTYGRRGSN